MQPDGGPLLSKEPRGDAPAAGGAEEEGLDRVLTVPNLLSVGRLGLLALFCFLLFGADERVAAVVVLAVAGATDFVDGYVARRFHQVSTIGKVLDPTADRIVLGTGVIAIALYGAVPGWLAGVVLGREVVVSLAVVVLAALGARRIDVLWVGKAGTFGLMAAFPLFLLADAGSTWAHVLGDVTWVLLVPSLALSFLAAVSYVPLARRALRARHEDGVPLSAGGVPVR
ncbi:MAG TPA: CDP-alcohol phosphatidyltransferase family protein [Acidimicrobiales bacterium]|nr:CDP-alcohol phosphatidyltransferase family protein [Acidimicrobiales bacterium]